MPDAEAAEVVDVDVHAPFDLSAVQQAYWLGRGDGEVLGNVSCHAFLEFRCRAIDPVRLDAACRLVRGAIRCCVRASPMDVSKSSRRRTRRCSRMRTGATGRRRGWKLEWCRCARLVAQCLDVERAQVFMMGKPCRCPVVKIACG